MKKWISITGVFFTIIGCSVFQSNISEKQAKEIVITGHSGDIGKDHITSISHQFNEYAVTWENQQNCESGKDYIDDGNGKIRKGEVTIC